MTVFFLGNIFGALILGSVYNWLGAKRVCWIIVPLALASWLITAFTTDYYIFMLTRLMAGITYGLIVSLGEMKWTLIISPRL